MVNREDANTIEILLKDGAYLAGQTGAVGELLHQYHIPGEYVISYLNQSYLDAIREYLGRNRPGLLPLVYGLLDRPALEAAGIIQMQQQPYMELNGNGVLVGFVDTGIDYTNNAFRYADGTSKLRYIWDQTIEDEPPEDFHFGTEYTGAEISRALASDNPLAIVPHRDTVGHGTFLASIAASHESGQYVGAAPNAELMVVKLRKARDILLQEYLVPPWQENAFASTDIILGVEYLLARANALQMPLVVCLALGTNLGGHDGFNPLEEYLSAISNRTGVCISVAAGNECQERHHTNGLIRQRGDTAAVEVIAPENSESFWVTLWCQASDRMSVGLRSPLGEIVNRVLPTAGTTMESGFVFERTRVSIRYYYPVGGTGAETIFIKIRDPTPGIWTINIFGDIILDGSFHMWLPSTGFATPGLAFLAPTPNFTVLSPATTIGIITSGAYDPATNRLYERSSWGPSRLPVQNPDFVAPGVNVGGIYPGGTGTMSGTSVSAAITAGACALMLEWGIVKRNEIALNTYRIRALLINGCEHDANVTYPNERWGYGKINLYNTFNLLRGSPF